MYRFARSISIVRCVLFLSVAVMTTSCGDSDPNPFLPNPNPLDPGSPGPKPASIVATSLLNHSGFAYEYLPEQLAVRVTDSNGAGLTGITIQWKVKSGSGQICSDKSYPCHRLEGATGLNGVSSIWFRPETLGMTVIEVSVAGLESSVKFEIVSEMSAPVVHITFGPLFDCMPSDPSNFIGADSTRNIKVSVGTIVEFYYYQGLGSCKARLVATSAPEGGELFDSGDMPSGSTYRFKPTVAGTWAFSETYNGGAATLTAY